MSVIQPKYPGKRSTSWTPHGSCLLWFITWKSFEIYCLQLRSLSLSFPNWKSALLKGKWMMKSSQVGNTFFLRTLLHNPNMAHPTSQDSWENAMGQVFFCFSITLPKTNIAHENRLSQKEISIPTSHFQVQTVSFREGRSSIFQNQTNYFDCQQQNLLCSKTLISSGHPLTPPA